METMTDYNYVWMNGKTLSKAFVDAYNNYSKEINRANNTETIDFLKDQRHRLLVLELNSYKMKDYIATSNMNSIFKFKALNDNEAKHYIINHCDCSQSWTFKLTETNKESA